MTAVNTDGSVNLPWKISRGTHNPCRLIFDQDVSAWSNWRLNIKLKEGSSESLLSLTSGQGLTIEDETHILVEFSEDQSAALKKPTYYYELLYDDENGKTKGLFRSDSFTVQNFNQGSPTSSVSVNLNTGDNVINVTVSAGSAFDISRFDPDALTTQQKTDLVNVLIDKIREIINDA